MYEDFVPGTATLLLGYVVGIGLGMYIAHDDGPHNVDQRIAQVQAYNHQLQPQLEVGGRVVAHLLLDDEGEHYTYSTRAKDNSNESCEGDYKVVNHHAQVSGSLTCSQTIKVGN